MPRSRTLGALVDELAATQPETDAVVFRGQRWSYAQLATTVDAIARALLASGVRRGDRVAVLLGNRPEWVFTLCAASRVGAITVGISTFSTPRELEWTLDHARPTVLVTADALRGHDYVAALHQIIPGLGRLAPGALRLDRWPQLSTIVGVGDRQHDAIERFTDFVARGDGVRRRDASAALATVQPDDPCVILYTSGSTATPKGVTLAHRGVIENGFAIGERQHLGPMDRLWLAVPLFWSFGSANALPAILTHGGTIVLQESFEPGEALELLERERCTVYYGMANMARAMLEHPDRARRRLDAMRTGLTIGLPEDVALTMEAVAARELCNVYGSTETYGNCAVTDAHDPRELRLTTQGLPLPGMDIRVVDPETSRVLPPGESGEFRVKGYTTPGYYRDPEQTRATFDADGYFKTGDLGLIGDDGRVRFRGRLKEMIKTAGVNVAPLEVEAVLLSHPGVKQAYVVGVPDRERGEAVVAAIELRESAMATTETLITYCRERLSSYKVPVRLAFRKADDFPRTPTGKIQKPRLREELTGSD